MSEYKGLIRKFMNEINEMQFIDINELFVKKKYVKERYSLMDIDSREIYKWYFFYQLCHLKNPLKCQMWEYINGFDNLDELNRSYIEYCDKR